MVFPRWLVWPLFAAIMGFALGGSVFWGLYGPNTTIEQADTAYEQKAPEPEAKCKKEETDEALARYTYWLMFFTGVLAFATVGLGVATVGLYLTGEKQIRLAAEASAAQSRDMQASIAAAQEANRITRENAISERRAWLDVTEAKLIPPTAFRETDLVFRIQYKIVNLGHTIARNVDAHVETWFPQTSVENFQAVRDRLLARARRVPTVLGGQIFPNDSQTIALLFQEGPEKFASGIRTRPDGAHTLQAHIFLTVSYRIEGETTPRVTQYVYDLLNLILPTAIPTGEHIELHPMPFVANVIE